MDGVASMGSPGSNQALDSKLSHISNSKVVMHQRRVADFRVTMPFSQEIQLSRGRR